MSQMGHSRSGRVDRRSGHVRIAPIAIDFCGAAKGRDVHKSGTRRCSTQRLNLARRKERILTATSSAR
jgi:hypothetical protein